MRDVQSSRGDISCDQASELAILEPLKGDFSRGLTDITVHTLNSLLDSVSESQLVSISFGRRETDRLALASIARDDVGQHRNSLIVWAVDDQVLDLLGSLVPQVLAKIDHLEVRLHVLSCKIVNPVRDRR